MQKGRVKAFKIAIENADLFGGLDLLSPQLPQPQPHMHDHLLTSPIAPTMSDGWTTSSAPDARGCLRQGLVGFGGAWPSAAGTCAWLT